MESTPVPCEPSTMTLAGDPDSAPISAGPVNFPIQPGAAGSNKFSSVIRYRRMVRGKGAPGYHSFVLGRNTSLTSNFPMPSIDSRGSSNNSSRQRRGLVMTLCSVGARSLRRGPQRHPSLGQVVRELRHLAHSNKKNDTASSPLEDWGKPIGDVPSATAILDRFLHRAETIQITGRSYRLDHGAGIREKTSNSTKVPTGSPSDK